MAVSEGFRTLALEQLGRVAPRIRARGMFGGVGVYSADRFFALLDDDVLYLKADDVTRPLFEAEGLLPFRPGGDSGEVMSYYAVSADWLEDPDALRPWVNRALGAAARKKSKPSRKARGKT